MAENEESHFEDALDRVLSRFWDPFLIVLVAVVTGSYWGFFFGWAGYAGLWLENVLIKLHWVRHFSDMGYVQALRPRILDGLWSLLWLLLIYICVAALTVILIRAVARRLGVGVVVGAAVLSVILVALAVAATILLRAS